MADADDVPAPPRFPSEIGENRQRFIKWYKGEVCRASALLAAYKRRIGRSQRTEWIDMPSASELVTTTYERIMSSSDERYIWQGNDFSGFFWECMRTTCESFRAEERRHWRKRDDDTEIDDEVLRRLRPDSERSEHEQALLHRDDTKALEHAVDQTRISGRMRSYLLNLPRYAASRFTTREIAAEINVSEKTIPSFRARALTNQRFLLAIKRELAGPPPIISKPGVKNENR